MLSIALTLAAASVAEQLAPAKQGMLECQFPNLESKTCFSLSKVRQTGPSVYAFDTDILIDAAGPVIATMHTKVFVRGSEICERMGAGEAAGATFSSNGRPLSGTDAADYRAKLRADFAPLAGRTVCTRNVAGDDGIETVVATVDGKRLPSGDYPMKWVAPAEGWKVEP